MDLSEILESSSSDEENEGDDGDGKESEGEEKEPVQEEVGFSLAHLFQHTQ